MRSFSIMILAAIYVSSSTVAAATLDQIPHLKSLPDFATALQQKIDEGRGNLLLDGDVILQITLPLVFDLAKHGGVSVQAVGRVTIVMDGLGPALRFVGTYGGTAAPKTFIPVTRNQRMPIVAGIEILGIHRQADSIELVQAVGAIIRSVSVRWCRHGIDIHDLHPDSLT
jgi:hypothetical protein